MTNPLSKYPRPASDNGWGFHDSAGTNRKPPNIEQYARYLRNELGTTWFKALVDGANKVDLARAFTAQSIEVIVRLYKHKPHPHHVVDGSVVSQYVGAGCHYFEWGNEPNLIDEWAEGEWGKGAQPDRVCEQFLRNAKVIKQAGGIPLFPSLSPGGNYPHRDFYRTAFEWLRLHGHLDDLEGCALAIHNRPLNHPLDYKDGSGCFFLDYEWIDDLVKSYLNHSLPLLGTEAGYEFGYDFDSNFPAITPELHRDYNLEILRSFGPHGRFSWRDALFCQCMWLVDNFGHPAFASAAWHRNPVIAGGGNLPAVEALKTEWRQRPFVRVFPWEETEDVIRNAAWVAGGIPYNPEAAFPKYAREHDLGNPETPEFDFTYQGKKYRGQGFSKAILYAEVGHWDDIKEASW